MLLHLGQNVITFRTLLHLGSFITFRPSTEAIGRGSREYVFISLETG